MGKYRSLPYYGGKRGQGAGALGMWIASHLPLDPNSTYIEPFAGMAGVLLARPPVEFEILNDLNDRLINWWRAVRDFPEEFGRLCQLTPSSREEFRWACGAVDDPEETPLRRALAFHILLNQGVSRGDASRSGGSWKRSIHPTGRGGRRRMQYPIEEMIPLGERLRNVQLECADALALLERTAQEERAVIYADPPYPSANTTPYRFGALDYKRLGELLQAQRGAVAVSGYPGEWDGLGWEEERAAATRYQINGVGEPRTECLWINERCREWVAAAPRLL